MKSFLIIGMGTFGHHLCRALCKLKCEVMIADQNGEALEDMLPYVASAKICDCANIEVLRSFGVQQFDACFVCVNQNFQACLEITDQLKELGGEARLQQGRPRPGGQVPPPLRRRLHHLPRA